LHAQDIEQFKHIWRCHSSDSTPETIPFRKLEHLLKEVGLCDGHTDDGAILGNPLAPRPRQEWTPEQLSNWTSVICQQQGVADLGVVQWLSPASVKSIIKALWVCDYACPLKSYREHILEGDAEGGTEWTESWPEMDSFRSESIGRRFRERQPHRPSATAEVTRSSTASGSHSSQTRPMT